MFKYRRLKTIECNNCGTFLTDEGASLLDMDTEGILSNIAEEMDWYVGYDNKTHYCNRCYYFDDYDNLVVNKKNQI